MTIRLRLALSNPEGKMESEELVVQTEEDGKLCQVYLLVFRGEDEYFEVVNSNIMLCPMRLMNGFSGQCVCYASKICRCK